MRHILVVGLLVVVAGPSFAQPSRVEPGEQQSQRRYQIRVLESVLVSAVQHAADTMSRRIQAVTPNIVLMTDTARARGFILPEYGVFFDVEVPGLPLSLAWTMRVMDRDFDVASSIDLVRRHVETIPDPAARREVEQALKRIELEVAPPPAASAPDIVGGRPTDAVRTATVAQPPGAAAAERPASPAPPAQDPNEAYTEVVKNALIDAMLDYSGPMGIGSDEWLTIAARDAHGPLFPGEAYDASTIVLRIKGSDLADFRAERISRDEARKRVEVREF